MIDLERQFNNHLRKRSVWWTAISAGLLMALGGTMTVAQANAVTNHAAPRAVRPRLSNDKLFNYSLRINLKPAVFNSDTPNLAEIDIDKHADVLHQQILTDAFSRPLNLSQTKYVTRSVNADHALNMSKKFRKASAPQTLSLPKSSNKRQIKHNRSVLTSRLQILIILYAVLSNLVDAPRIRNGAASNDSEPKEAPLVIKPQPKSVKVTITFWDVYGEIDGLKAPEAIIKKGTRNKGYSVSAPDDWALIEPNGTVTDRLTFYYRDGDQALAVAPCYKGVTYKYDRKAGRLEFTRGNFNHVQPALPPRIAPHVITSVKFDRRLHVNPHHLRAWFSYYPNLRTIDIKGHVIDRQPEINGESFRSRIRDVEPSDRSSRQAETGALDELSMMIGELSNEDHK